MKTKGNNSPVLPDRGGQPERQGVHLLFVCTYNEMRSSTAETVFTAEGLNARSAGTDRWATVPLTREIILWADIVFVMEEKHSVFITSEFQDVSEGKRIIVLGIPDNYYYMEPALTEMLKERVAPHLENDK